MTRLESFTNSVDTCARRCARELELRYEFQLSPGFEDREVLQVGDAWHRGHDVLATTSNPELTYGAISTHAPGELWQEKLRRLFAAYLWRWQAQPLRIVHSEHRFDVVIAGEHRRGRIDAIAEIDGRRGIVERKTTAEDINDGAPYWDRLRMDTQLSTYDVSYRLLCGEPPAFILYDVVRKPTIRPKGILKKDAERFRRALATKGAASYFGELFSAPEIDAALAHDLETSRMYGARLTSDIGDRPDFYFARRMVPRTDLDLEHATRDTVATMQYVRWLESRGEPFPRNPNACNVFGLCDFFGLCSNNEYPGAGRVPDGFKRREHLHPELDDDNQAPGAAGA